MINLLNKALELLKIFEEHGYEAYLVGGFVRDYIIQRPCIDVDVCTNATPMQVKQIFGNVELPFEQYGAVHLTYNKVDFEITTYRVDLEYNNGRSPSKIVYTDKLKVDLQRRDFTINTLCMDSKGNIIDTFNGLNDINRKTIRCVGDAYKSFREDSLRMLRAIRFATELNFNLDDDLKKAIISNRSSLKKLSFFRKKQELNRIFSSPNAIRGMELIRLLKLDAYLGISLDKDVIKTNDPIGVWAQISPDERYPFTSNEHGYLKSIIRVVKDKRINDMELYREGNYVCYIAAQILKLDEVNVYDRYDALPIKKVSDIMLKPLEIINYLRLEDRSVVKEIIRDLEEKIINRKIPNTKEAITNYLASNYTM